MPDDLIHNVQIEQERSFEPLSGEKPLNLQIEDPFVTSGLIALKQITKKPYEQCSDEDLISAVEIIVSYYLTPSFTRELYSLFPNSKYINPSVKDKKTECNKFLKEIIKTRNNEKTAFCQLCGKPADSTPFMRDVIPLVGSGGFANFFPSYQSGIHVCPRCILAIQFCPTVMYKIGGKPALINSSNPYLLEEYCKEAIHKLKEKVASDLLKDKDNSAILEDQFKNPINAVFHLAYKFGSQYPDAGKCSRNETIVIYKIDNYLQGGSGVTIYKLPAGVFSFIAQLMNTPENSSSWFSFLNYYYPHQKKEDEDIRKTGRNLIHEKLLNNESIIREFRKQRTRVIQNLQGLPYSSQIIPYLVVEKYMEIVRNMNKERIIKIRDFADQISECIKITGKKKRINALIAAKTLEEFRNQIRLIISDWQKTGNPDPLIGYEDFITIIIPGDYRGWTEVRDLIIIRIYENLHDILSKEEIEE